MRFALAVAFAAVIAHAYPGYADRIGVDPNITRPATTAPAQERPDQRLNQKVSYTATDKRLHAVLDDISKQTGVALYSGKSPADWQVRDLPVIVCVKDLPLGKLLRSIADAAHLALSSTTVKGVTSYRIWRDPKRERQLEDYLKKKSEADLARAKWEWDGLVKFAQAHGADKSQDIRVMTTRDMGKMVSALPTDALDSVLSGRHVHLTLQNTQPPLLGYLKAVYLDWWQSERRIYESLPDSAAAYRYNRDLNDFELATMSLDIALTQGGQVKLDCQLQYPLGFRRSTSLESIYNDVLAKEEGSHDKEPKDPAPPCTEYAPSLVRIDLDKPGTVLPDTKVRIAPPKPGEEMTYPDVISRISEASGFGVVLENLQGHRWRSEEVTGLPIYDRDIDLNGLLSALQQGSWLSKSDWRVDGDSNLLVGSNLEWHKLHRLLVPEALVSNIVKKYHGDGLQFDDILPSVLLSEDQREEWIFLHKDLFAWEPAPHTEPFWRLYASLSPENQALAKSPEGLLLGKHSPDVVRAAFVESSELTQTEGLEKRMEGMTMPDDPDLEKRVEEWRKQHYPEMERAMLGVDPLPVDFVKMIDEMVADFPELKAQWDIPTDMDVIGKLRMRLIKREYDTESFPDEDGKLITKPIPEELRTHTYTLAIQGGGVNLLIKAPLYSYPLYSEKRRKQLEEARKKSVPENAR